MKNQKEQIAAATVMASLMKRAKPLIGKLTDLEIVDADSYATAALRVSNIKQLGKLAEEEEDTIARPINEALKATRAHFKPFKDQVKLIETDTKAKMIAYINLTEQKSAKLLEDFENGKIKSLETVVTKQAELKDLDNSAAQVRKVKDVEVYAPKQLAPKYLVPDLAAIKKALLAGKQVKGARLVIKTSIAI